jgi:hypothetical protein
MYYRDRGACFEVGEGDNTGAIPRRQAGLLSIEKVRRPWPPPPPVPRSLYFCMLRREFATRN